MGLGVREKREVGVRKRRKKDDGLGLDSNFFELVNEGGASLSLESVVEKVP